MESFDDLGRRNPAAIKFRQHVSYTARTKIFTSTTEKELINRFDKCWNDFIKVLPQHPCYDHSWLFSQLFNCITRFCDINQKEHIIDILREKYKIHHLVLTPPRSKKPPSGVSKARRVYISSSKKQINEERKVRTLDETKEISGIDFSYVISSYGVVFPNTQVLKELSIQLQPV